jgi:hypothetical protein
MARECERFVRETRDPEELHVFATLWNWDGDNDAMLAVTRNPACDAGTALMIYWLNGPEYFCRFDGPEAASEYERDGYALHSEVEARLLAGEFSSRRIPYDPRADGLVTGQTAPGRRVPPELYEPVGGESDDA